MAIDWRAWGQGDWQRVAGATRRYRNRVTGQEIARRQYDEHYGSASAFGTYERKAKHKGREFEALLRPARSRKSGLKLTEPIRGEVIQVRREEKLQRQIAKLITRKTKRRIRTSSKITGKSFKAKAVGRTFELPIALEAIESLRQELKRWGNVFGYFVGVNFIDTRTGDVGAFAFSKLQAMGNVFTKRKFDDLLEEIAVRQYIEPFSLFLYAALKIDYARKRGYKK